MIWIVAQTQPRRERWAAENVARQGYEFYMPHIQMVKGKVVSAQPLFPRYLFIRTAGQWRFLLGTFGVTGVILNGEGPAVMPDRNIDELRQRENSDGMVMLPVAPRKRFAQGDEIRVSGGAFAGLAGIYDDAAPQERAHVLLEYLGRKTRVLIGEDYLVLK